MAMENGRWRSQRKPRDVFIPSMRPNRFTTIGGNKRNIGDFDRFIPARSSMDMDFARSMLTEASSDKFLANKKKKNEAYMKRLAKALMQNRSRILSFKSNPSSPVGSIFQEACSGDDISSDGSMSMKKLQSREIPQSAIRTLDAPDLVDDYYLNLLDWGSRNVLSIALYNTIYLWNATNGSVFELMTVDDDRSPITSVSWAPDGRRIAIGLNSSDVELWDANSSRLLRRFRGVHGSRVGSLDWNNGILTTGDMDGIIVNNDVRVRSQTVQTYKGHTLEVCGLKWSDSGRRLASGGNDRLLYIWDPSMSSSTAPPNQNQWLHKFDGHNAAVKALAWCPFQSSLLASGAGMGDHCIKFWNSETGTCVKSVDTGSQVSSLLWNNSERELLSSHGCDQNQLILWKYPSMDKVVELKEHTGRVLCMAKSPDGRTVASAGADERLKIWNVFETPKAPKAATNTANAGPLSSFSYIR